MATATPNTSQIPAPRVPLIDERTGLVSQQWFRWFNNIYALTGSGAGITPVTNGGTGTGNIPTNGQLLIGNGTDYSLSVITAGANITITNTAGHITIASAGALSSFSAGTTGFTPSTPTTGAITLAGTLIAANGGTGFASYAVGDLLYANTTTTLAKLADVATGNALISGGVSTAPSWGKIGLTTHVSGTLPIANGGTNATATPAAGAVAYGTGTAYDFTAVGTSGQVLTSAGAGTPTWTTPTTGTVTAVTGTAPVVSSGGTTPAISMAAASASTDGYLTSTDWTTFNSKGSGTVTSVSVVSANGLAGTSSGGATPALTLSTTITGLLKGNGTAISAATSGTDYAPATSGTSILYGNGSGGFSNVTVGTGLTFLAGTLSAATSAPITKTADFTVGAGETWFINNKSGSTCTVTLPTPSTNTGRQLNFKNTQAQTLVSASSNVVGLAGGAAATAILAASTGDWAALVSDGTNWIIMQAAANNCLLLE
jgi:hypothetical protein